MEESIILQEVPCKFGCRIKTFAAYPTLTTSLEGFLQVARPEILKVLRENINLLGCLKVNIFVEAQYLNNDEILTINLKTKNREMYKSGDLEGFLDGEISKIVNEMREYQLKGSSYVFSNVVKLELRLNRHCTY
jgi:hypothetical protein